MGFRELLFVGCIVVLDFAIFGGGLRAATPVVWGGDPPVNPQVEAEFERAVGVAAGGSVTLLPRGDGTMAFWEREGLVESLALANDTPIMLIATPGDRTIYEGEWLELEVRANSAFPYQAQWYHAEDLIPGATNDIFRIDSVTLSDAGEYRWVASNVLGQAESISQVTVRPLILDDSMREGGVEATWSTSGSAPWFAQVEYVHSLGGTAARSGAIDDREESVMETTINGPATLRFWWKASCQSDGDYCKFEVNGVEQGRISGNVQWEERVIYLPQGEMALRWSYVKDGAFASLHDAVWVDDLTVDYGGTAVTIVGRLKDVAAFPRQLVRLEEGALGTPPISFQWFKNGTVLPGETAGSLTFQSADSSSVGHYMLVVSNEFGLTTTSANVALVPIAGFGANEYGQIDVPLDLTEATMVAAGREHSLALRPDGTVVVWGDNQFGQATVPEELQDVIQICGGRHHSLALDASGHVTAWGDNSTGQLDVPQGLMDVTMIAAGNWHNLALTRDGTVMAWGYDGNGEASVPPGLSNIVSIAAGYRHSLALRANGTVVGWGEDADGHRDFLDNLTNIVAITAGAISSFALEDDGTAHATGLYFESPAALIGATNLVAIASRSYHLLGIRRDGGVQGWGDEEFGRTYPQRRVTNAVGLGPGRDHSLVLIGDGSPAITVQPISHRVTGGTEVVLKAMAAGVSPLHYQWQSNGSILEGETNSFLKVTAVRADARRYVLVISNEMGVAESHGVVVDARQPQILQSLVMGEDGSYSVVFGNRDGSSMLAEDIGRFEVSGSSNLIDWIELTNAAVLWDRYLKVHDPESPYQPARYYRVVQP